MNYYIINTSQDYADEFYYPVVVVMTEYMREFLLHTYEHWKMFNYDEIYFGTNEYLSFDALEIYDYIQCATQVDKQFFNKIKPFLTDASCDVVEYVLEHLVYKGIFASDIIVKANTTPFNELKLLYPEDLL